MFFYTQDYGNTYIIHYDNRCNSLLKEIFDTFSINYNYNMDASMMEHGVRTCVYSRAKMYLHKFKVRKNIKMHI